MKSATECTPDQDLADRCYACDACDACDAMVAQASEWLAGADERLAGWEAEKRARRNEQRRFRAALKRRGVDVAGQRTSDLRRRYA